jgi:hypothetical protein
VILWQGDNWRHGSDVVGQKQTLGKVRLMSALPPKADIGGSTAKWAPGRAA